MKFQLNKFAEKSELFLIKGLLLYSSHGIIISNQWKNAGGEVMMMQFNQPTSNIIQASAMRRSAVVLVMHFYNFDTAPEIN